MKDLMTTKELADFLRLNEKKVYQLIKEGDIPHVRMSGKWLFPKDHILRWIDENVQREKDIFIVGSDDILMSRLLSLYSRERFPESSAFYSSIGSLRGIYALSRKKGHACCTHLLDMETGEYNLPILNRVLSYQKYVVINLWHRQQGLIVKKGNPLAIKSLEAIIDKNARFVNRNEGSGTRILFEYLLRDKNLRKEHINGYDNIADTHFELGLEIFFDRADVGLGIQYITHLLPLDFIPVKKERFDLVVPKELWSTRVMQGFVSYLDSSYINKLSYELPGYSLNETGKIIFES